MRVGLDIGGTKTEAVLVDHDGVPVGGTRIPTGFGAEQVLITAETAVRRVTTAAGVPLTALSAVGVGVPGAVDVDLGRLRHAVNLGVASLDLGELLGERLGLPVRVENDVNAAALGAFQHLQQQRLARRSMAYLNLGTGLACGVVLDGRLWRGEQGVAGEIGHISVDPQGRACACGQRGCLETVCSGSAVAHLWPVAARLPAADLFAAAAAGRAEAVDVRRRLCMGVAAAVRIIVLTMDVEHIMIGGGLSRVGRPLLDHVREALQAATQGSPFLAALGLPARISLAPVRGRIAAMGAALVAQEAVTSGPATNGAADRPRSGVSG